MTFERWSALMASWGLSPNESTWRKLTAAYAQGHRHYHTGAHVDACLRHLDACAARLDQPQEVELALWFHDAVYRPLSSKNERKSAEWASAFLESNHVPAEVVQRVRALIMATRHEVPPQTRDESYLVDIDLAILGAEPAVYDNFERAVRREYRLVPARLYRAGRARLLRQFLGHPRIYRNLPFTQREDQARANLARAIEQLEASG